LEERARGGSTAWLLPCLLVAALELFALALLDALAAVAVCVLCNCACGLTSNTRIKTAANTLAMVRTFTSLSSHRYFTAERTARQFVRRNDRRRGGLKIQSTITAVFEPFPDSMVIALNGGGCGLSAETLRPSSF
jgi:hypothetical protein